MNIAKAGTSFASLLLAAAMVGCNGQNPLQHKSDPIPQYHNLTAKNQGNRPYNSAMPPAPLPPDPDNSQSVCYEPFKISVDNDRGSKLLTFTEDTAGVYKIQVRSLMGDNFRVEAVGLPAGASFTQVSKASNVAIYAISWTPSKGHNSQLNIQTVGLRYSSDAAQKCGQDIHENLNLVVLRTEGEPTLSYKNVQQSTLTLGDVMHFVVEINDPASTRDMGPDLNAPQFEAWATSAEHPVLDASGSVHCETPGKFVGGTRWQFNCSLDTSRIKHVDKEVDSANSLDAAFFLVAVSKRGASKFSNPTPLYVKVTIPKIEAKEKIVENAAATGAPIVVESTAPSKNEHQSKTEPTLDGSLDRPAKLIAEPSVAAQPTATNAKGELQMKSAAAKLPPVLALPSSSAKGVASAKTSVAKAKPLVAAPKPKTVANAAKPKAAMPKSKTKGETKVSTSGNATKTASAAAPKAKVKAAPKADVAKKTASATTAAPPIEKPATVKNTLASAKTTEGDATKPKAKKMPKAKNSTAEDKTAKAAVDEDTAVIGESNK